MHSVRRVLHRLHAIIHPHQLQQGRQQVPAVESGLGGWVLYLALHRLRQGAGQDPRLLLDKYTHPPYPADSPRIPPEGGLKNFWR